MFIVIVGLQVVLMVAFINGLEQIKRIIVMTQAEAAQTIKELTAQVSKIGAETSTSLQKITELEALVATGGGAGGTVTQEMVDAIAGLKTQVQATDDLVPDAPPTP